MQIVQILVIVAALIVATYATPERVNALCSSVRLICQQCSVYEGENTGRPRGEKGEKGDKGSPGVVNNGKIEDMVEEKFEDMGESLAGELRELKTTAFQLQAEFEELKFLPVKDCSKVFADEYIRGNETRGVFKMFVGRKTIHAFCDLLSDGGGWTVIQRRMNGSVDFFRNFSDYVTGFGNVSGEFWMGLENIYNIVEGRKFQMRIDLEDWDGIKKVAKYSHFGISNRYEDYRLAISGYSGTAGDAMAAQNGQKFSTKDHDVDSHAPFSCAQRYKGGWWYNNCHHSNLNGLYHEATHETYADGVSWRQWKGYYYSLKFVEMKIRPIA